MGLKMIMNLVAVVIFLNGMLIAKCQHQDNFVFPDSTNVQKRTEDISRNSQNVVNQFISQPTATEIPQFAPFAVPPNNNVNYQPTFQNQRVVDPSLIQQQNYEAELRLIEEQNKQNQLEQQRLATQRRQLDEQLKQQMNKDNQQWQLEQQKRQQQDQNRRPSGVDNIPNRPNPNINPLSFQLGLNNRPQGQADRVQPEENPLPQVRPPHQNPPQPQQNNYPTTGAGGQHAVYSGTYPVVAFAWKLFKFTPSNQKNLVLSPILPQLSLALLTFGAEGTTKQQLNRVVEAHASTLDHVIQSFRGSKSAASIEYASAMFASREFPLNKTFSQIANDRGVDVVPVNFRQSSQAVNNINSWISRATKNTIPNFLDQSTDVSSVEFLLTNAIYFKSAWKYRFNKTERDVFYYPNGQAKETDFLKTKRYFRSGSISLGGISREANWIEVPYDSDDFSMVFVVPSNRNTLDDMISQLKPEDIQDILGSLDHHNLQSIELKVPKFDIETRNSLVGSLSSMGLNTLFSDQSQLPYIKQSSSSVTIADCIHHARLSVDEVGTVASAANAFSIIPLSISLPDPELPFVVDQPFLSIIVAKRFQIPIFVSKIYYP